MAMPLDDVAVVDLGSPTPGKYATFLLAQTGAVVVRVDRPGARGAPLDDEDRVLNRGKRSLTLDLRQEAGQDVLHRLVAAADVLVESYRPGVSERLGADWPTLSKINPNLVYCSLSGFGQTGPDRSLPAYDLNLAGLSGLLSALFGVEAAPRVPEAFVADGVSGLTATVAIAMALLERQRTGEGRWLDLAMLDSTFSLLGVSHGLGQSTGDDAAEPTSSSPWYSIYETADGAYVTLAAIRPASMDILCREIGQPELAEAVATGESGTTVAAALREAFKTAPAADWIERLRPMGVEIGRVHRPGDAFDDAQLRARGLVEDVVTEDGATRPIVTSPFRPIWGRADEASRSAPRAGRDCDEILGELGYEAADIARLRENGTI